VAADDGPTDVQREVVSAVTRPAALHDYVFHGGRDGRERLRVLARVTAPYTGELFDRIGVGPGWHCLDVGCGGGDVTIELARRVRPGVAIGVDLDEAQLALARQEGDAAELDNVEYRVGDATRLGELARRGRATHPFDLVYARFVLTHLREPEGALAGMVSLARSGGVVAVEDIDSAGAFCAPPNPAFDRYVDWNQRAHRARGGDPAIGLRLPQLLQAAGLQDVQVRVVQPAGLHGEITRIAPLTLAAAAGSIVAADVATDDEVAELHRQLEALSADRSSVVTMPRIVQAWARRP
jgi:ubiquinone/menaquinone biosynthesis C-methylase UbiE